MTYEEFMEGCEAYWLKEDPEAWRKYKARCGRRQLSLEYLCVLDEKFYDDFVEEALDLYELRELSHMALSRRQKALIDEEMEDRFWSLDDEVSGGTFAHPGEWPSKEEWKDFEDNNPRWWTDVEHPVKEDR